MAVIANGAEKDLPTGSHDYRAFVGPPNKYDLVSAMQFNLLTALGLREHHSLLDIGCGSLRAGRLFIPFLLPGHYYGIEPEQWLIEEGIDRELGHDVITLKQPVFSNDSNFTLSTFGRTFDFLLAQSIFSHASATQIRRCLDEACRVMTPTSIFAATFIKGDSNYTGEEWVYPGCVTYTPDFMAELAQEVGLALKPIKWAHPTEQTIVVIAHPDYIDQIELVTRQDQMEHLERELTAHHQALQRLETHPYVRFGIGFNNLLRRLMGRDTTPNDKD